MKKILSVKPSLTIIHEKLLKRCNHSAHNGSYIGSIANMFTEPLSQHRWYISSRPCWMLHWKIPVLNWALKWNYRIAWTFPPDWSMSTVWFSSEEVSMMTRAPDLILSCMKSAFVDWARNQYVRGDEISCGWKWLYILPVGLVHVC